MTDEPTAAQIHVLEQQWEVANAQLDEMLEMLRVTIVEVKEQVGLTDTSVVFSFVWDFIQKSHAAHGLVAVKSTEIMWASAMTRLLKESQTQQDSEQQWLNTGLKLKEFVEMFRDLARASRVEDEMMQFEKGMRDGNC
jgi:hypothetical protein